MDSLMEDLIARAARDLVASNYAIALTGAGVSTESGIPDFRGPSGVWTKNPKAEEKAYESWPLFLQDPRRWWEERLLGSGSLLGDLEKLKPNASHYALVELERMGILKCVITQNVDGLHEKAGSTNLLEYHGSSLKLRCIYCNARFRPDAFDLAKLRADGNLPPRCPSCGGFVKSDGVAFGEPIPSDVADLSLEEANLCDLMLICGTSAVVYPCAYLPRVARERQVKTERITEHGERLVKTVPAATIVEVNAEPTSLTREGISDYLIQGKTGEILPRIVEEIERLRSLSS